MTASMLHGGDAAAGSMTSGGTESIFMAMKTAREWCRKNKPDVAKPKIIAAPKKPDPDPTPQVHQERQVVWHVFRRRFVPARLLRSPCRPFCGQGQQLLKHGRRVDDAHFVRTCIRDVKQ